MFVDRLTSSVMSSPLNVSFHSQQSRHCLSTSHFCSSRLCQRRRRVNSFHCTTIGTASFLSSATFLEFVVTTMFPWQTQFVVFQTLARCKFHLFRHISVCNTSSRTVFPTSTSADFFLALRSVRQHRFSVRQRHVPWHVRSYHRQTSSLSVVTTSTASFLPFSNTVSSLSFLFAANFTSFVTSSANTSSRTTVFPTSTSADLSTPFSFHCTTIGTAASFLSSAVQASFTTQFGEPILPLAQFVLSTNFTTVTSVLFSSSPTKRLQTCPSSTSIYDQYIVSFAEATIVFRPTDFFCLSHHERIALILTLSLRHLCSSSPSANTSSRTTVFPTSTSADLSTPFSFHCTTHIVTMYLGEGRSFGTTDRHRLRQNDTSSFKQCLVTLANFTSFVTSPSANTSSRTTDFPTSTSADLSTPFSFHCTTIGTAALTSLQKLTFGNRQLFGMFAQFGNNVP